MQKRLVRKDKKIAGVCGGLGAYFEQDPLIFRILFVAGVLIFGTGVLLYLVMAIIIPDGEKAG
jgi:phage shock protein PspC (stress-responsive transcriptional regulator)